MDIPINQVDTAGRTQSLGALVPVRPEGFAMVQADGVALHSAGLPWWLLDMTPMAFAPGSGGGLPDTLPEANIHASVPNPVWHQAEALARAFLGRLTAATGFSQRFSPCISALEQHIASAGAKIARLG